MARGFTITVGVPTADDLNADAIAAELSVHRQLTGLEREVFIPAAVLVGKALCEALGDGPFRVNLSGVDRTGETGEQSSLGVSVDTDFTASEDNPGAHTEFVADHAAADPVNLAGAKSWPEQYQARQELAVKLGRAPTDEELATLTDELVHGAKTPQEQADSAEDSGDTPPETGSGAGDSPADTGPPADPGAEGDPLTPGPEA